MSSIARLISREPAITADLIKAALVCAVAFGLPLDTTQTTAVLGLAVTILGLGVGVRSVVTPVASLTEATAATAGKALDTATVAAQVAATQVAMILDKTTAGSAGAVTKAGEEVVDKVVEGVNDLLGAVR